MARQHIFSLFYTACIFLAFLTLVAEGTKRLFLHVAAAELWENSFPALTTDWSSSSSAQSSVAAVIGLTMVFWNTIQDRLTKREWTLLSIAGKEFQPYLDNLQTIISSDNIVPEKSTLSRAQKEAAVKELAIALLALRHTASELENVDKQRRQGDSARQLRRDIISLLSVSDNASDTDITDLIQSVTKVFFAARPAFGFGKNASVEEILDALHAVERLDQNKLDDSKFTTGMLRTLGLDNNGTLADARKAVSSLEQQRDAVGQLITKYVPQWKNITDPNVLDSMLADEVFKRHPRGNKIHFGDLANELMAIKPQPGVPAFVAPADASADNVIGAVKNWAQRVGKHVCPSDQASSELWESMTSIFPEVQATAEALTTAVRSRITLASNSVHPQHKTLWDGVCSLFPDATPTPASLLESIREGLRTVASSSGMSAGQFQLFMEATSKKSSEGSSSGAYASFIKGCVDLCPPKFDGKSASFWTWKQAMKRQLATLASEPDVFGTKALNLVSKCLCGTAEEWFWESHDELEIKLVEETTFGKALAAILEVLHDQFGEDEADMLLQYRIAWEKLSIPTTGSNWKEFSTAFGIAAKHARRNPEDEVEKLLLSLPAWITKKLEAVAVARDKKIQDFSYAELSKILSVAWKQTSTLPPVSSCLVGVKNADGSCPLGKGAACLCAPASVPSAPAVVPAPSTDQIKVKGKWSPREAKGKTAFVNFIDSVFAIGGARLDTSPDARCRNHRRIDPADVFREIIKSIKALGGIDPSHDGRILWCRHRGICPNCLHLIPDQENVDLFVPYRDSVLATMGLTEDVPSVPVRN